jgi:hypothetical protein
LNEEGEREGSLPGEAQEVDDGGDLHGDEWSWLWRSRQRCWECWSALLRVESWCLYTFAEACSELVI